jgi:5-methylcytosine-specific restriction endonuclease McrA
MSCTTATGTPGSLEVRSAIEISDNKFRRAKGMLPWENVGWKEQFSSLPTMHAPRPRSSGVRYAVLEQHQHPPAEDSRALRQKPKPQKGRKRAAQKRIYDLGPIQQTEAEAIASAIAQAPAYEFDEFDVYRGLVLDISYKPIDIINWKRAICMDIFQKADVLTYYDQYVHSAYAAYPLPAVLRVHNYVNLPKSRMRVVLSRTNILIRDKNRCQYCGSPDDLTIDHVVAASRGGDWSWTNLVAACGTCNLKKGNLSVADAGMRLMRQPREPIESDFPPLSHKNLGGRHTPPEWYDYLPNRLKFF